MASTPIKLHSAQEKSELSPIIKQLAIRNKLCSIKQLSLFEISNAEMVLNLYSKYTNKVERKQFWIETLFGLNLSKNGYVNTPKHFTNHKWWG